MKFSFPINVVTLIMGSPKTCEDLLLHLVVWETLPIIVLSTVPGKVQPLPHFLFNWNLTGISIILSLEIWILRTSNVLSPLACFRIDIAGGLSLQKRKIEMKISWRVLYTHTLIVQEVQNKLKIAFKGQDAQYLADFQYIHWAQGNSDLDGQWGNCRGFILPCCCWDNQLIPTVLQCSVKMSAVQLPSHNPSPTSMPQKLFQQECCSRTGNHAITFSSSEIKTAKE